jgi:DNA-binding transcriptional LysR family regulator
MNDKSGCSPIDWEDVRFFAALARHRTVAATARVLEVTHAAVMRRLASLESRLGSPLFVRRARGFSLTSAGASVLAEAAQMEMAACAVAQMCTGSFPRTVPGVPSRRRRSSRH